MSNLIDMAAFIKQREIIKANRTKVVSRGVLNSGYRSVVQAGRVTLTPWTEEELKTLAAFRDPEEMQK